VTPTVAERYLRLGLELGRHVDGIVDAYFGPPELAEVVGAEPPADPRQLVAAAEGLLDELGDGWLRDQVIGLRSYAGVLAGEPTTYADEVEGCYGVRPTHTDEAVFAAAHEELAGLLPGEGTLAERHERWESSIRVPNEKIEATMTAVIEEARARTRELARLPDGEGVTVEIVRGEPWLAFCEYLGGYQSRISVNVDLPVSAIELLWIAMHETYPGHHTERCLKEHELVQERGLLEETIVLVPTPQSLIAEGIAKLAPYMLLEEGRMSRFAAIIAEAGIEFDLGHALAVRRALEPCAWADVNAALMLHAEGAGEAEVHGYLRRWGLMSSELADHILRFFREPTSRSYVVTYPAGHKLCGAYVDGQTRRFQRLLTEQMRVGELRGA
jgi:hypothetical protein